MYLPDRASARAMSFDNVELVLLLPPSLGQRLF